MEQAWGEAQKSAFLVGIPGVSYPKSHCKKHSMRKLHRILITKIKTRDEFALGKMVYQGPTSCPPTWNNQKKKKVSKEKPDKIMKHWFSRPCMLCKEDQSSLRDGGSCNGPALPWASRPRSSKDGSWWLPELRRQNSESKDKTKEARESVASRACRENADHLQGPLESPVRKLGARNKWPERTRRDRVLSLHRSYQPDWKPQIHAHWVVPRRVLPQEQRIIHPRLNTALVLTGLKSTLRKHQTDFK